MLRIRGLTAGLVQRVLAGVCLIVPAGLVPGGTWSWERALIFLAVYGFILEAAVVTFAVVAPARLEARLKPPVSQKPPVPEQVVTVIMVLTFFGWIVFIPVDVFCLKLLPAPAFAVSVCGAMLSLLGFAIVAAAVYQNSFAIPIVEDQSEWGQTLVDTGLYAFVRHPWYLGLLAFQAGIALWLESYAGTIAVSVLLVVSIARIVAEEATLQKTLPGYTEYMKNVRYRLVPFIW